MSGAGIVCCRVCGTRLKRWTDYDFGLLLESEESCPACDLYESAFQYGGHWERYGVVETTWHHQDEKRPGDWRAEENEAKLILGSDTGRAMFKAARDGMKAGDATPLVIFADWCDENECPLNAAYIRETTRES